MKKVLLAIIAIAFVPLFAQADTSTPSASGATQTGMTQVGMAHTGADGMKGLHLAMGQLSPTDKAVLVKMISDYLISKGIDPAKYAEKREEIREIRKDTKSQIKDMRKTTREEIKKKREEMRTKIKSMRTSSESVETAK